MRRVFPSSATCAAGTAPRLALGPTIARTFSCSMRRLAASAAGWAAPWLSSMTRRRRCFVPATLTPPASLISATASSAAFLQESPTAGMSPRQLRDHADLDVGSALAAGRLGEEHPAEGPGEEECRRFENKVPLHNREAYFRKGALVKRRSVLKSPLRPREGRRALDGRPEGASREVPGAVPPPPGESRRRRIHAVQPEEPSLPDHPRLHAEGSPLPPRPGAGPQARQVRRGRDAAPRAGRTSPSSSRRTRPAPAARSRSPATTRGRTSPTSAPPAPRSARRRR